MKNLVISFYKETYKCFIRLTMNSNHHFSKIKTNLEVLRKIGAKIPNGEYLCPVCFRPFKESEIPMLTEEDVPQASLGGSRITLTCRSCNSNCGSSIDVHLLGAIKTLEQKEFIPNTDRKVSVLVDGQKLNAILRVKENKDIFLEVDTKRNNPKVWDDFRENKLLPEAIVDLQDVPLKHQQERIEAAIIKNAYLLLFAKTGFSVLSHRYYDCFRNVILDPDNYQIPTRLWTMQNVACPDGVFMSENEGIKGLIISYTLSLKKSYKFLVFIPLPGYDYNEVKKALTNFVPGKIIKLIPFDTQKDYLTDEIVIKELRKWCGLDD